MTIVPLKFLQSKEYNINRANVIMRLYELFINMNNNNFNNLTPYKRDAFITNIEKSIYEKTVYSCNTHNVHVAWDNTLFINKYSNESYRIISQIDTQSCANDPNFANKIIDDKLQNVAFLESRDLAPQLYKPIEESIEVRKRQIIIQKVSKLYKCPKCGQKQSRIEEVQLRSFDEGANVSACCCNCFHTWIAA
jgi:DNA-directed RNA polymerase subunit M/transcription elongation factor TFIIS